MYREVKKGSITIFLILLLTAVLSGVFAFLEAARVECLKANVRMSTALAKDAVLASYQPELWKNYHLLFYEAKNGNIDSIGELQKSVVNESQAETLVNALFRNYYLMQVNLTEAKVDSYQLATDNGGIPFAREAAGQLVTELPRLLSKELLDYVEGKVKTNGDKEESDKTEEEIDETPKLIEAAEDAAESASSSGESSSTELAVVPDTTTEVATVEPIKLEVNPVEWITKLRSDGPLGLVMGDKHVSDKKIDTSDSISKRTLKTGNYPEEEPLSIKERVAYSVFLSQHFGNASNVKGGRVLDYEVEYMINGLDSDRDNLRSTVLEISLIREVANLGFLEKNAKRKAIARAAAYTICAVLAGQEEFAEPVMHGILAVWAYAESINDVKQMLAGNRVPIIKSDKTWRTDITKIASSVEDKGEKITDKIASMGYEDYLLVLICVKPQKKLFPRTMDLIEKSFDVHMDDMVTQMKCSYTFEAEPLFSKLIMLNVDRPGKYTWNTDSEISYYPLLLNKKKETGQE